MVAGQREGLRGNGAGTGGRRRRADRAGEFAHTGGVVPDTADMGRKQRREAARTRVSPPPVTTTPEGPGGEGRGATALAERPTEHPTGHSAGHSAGRRAAHPAARRTGRPAPTGAASAGPGRLAAVRRWWPVLLLRAAHPRQAVLTALALGLTALLAGREAREAGLVAVTVLVGQGVAGWHHDLTDRARDRRHQADRKPLAGDDLDPGTVWFAVACGLLLVVPLSISTGVVAGSSYLAVLLVTLLGNLVLRRGVLSWLPWAISFGLYPAYLTYGGWGGDSLGDPPGVLVTVLAALLGVAVHLVRSAPGLVVDHEEGWRTLPVRLALRMGAGRVLLLGGTLATLLVAALLLVGAGGGLTR